MSHSSRIMFGSVLQRTYQSNNINENEEEIMKKIEKEEFDKDDLSKGDNNYQRFLWVK